MNLADWLNCCFCEWHNKLFEKAPQREVLLYIMNIRNMIWPLVFRIHAIHHVLHSWLRVSLFVLQTVLQYSYPVDYNVIISPVISAYWRTCPPHNNAPLSIGAAETEAQSSVRVHCDADLHQTRGLRRRSGHLPLPLYSGSGPRLITPMELWQRQHGTLVALKWKKKSLEPRSLFITLPPFWSCKSLSQDMKSCS